MFGFMLLDHVFLTTHSCLYYFYVTSFNCQACLEIPLAYFFSFCLLFLISYPIIPVLTYFSAYA